MPRIDYLESHVVYDNPRPHLHSRHAYFPGLVVMPSGELLCLFVMAEAFEAPNGTTWITRSSDAGRTWTLQGRLHNSSIVGGVQTTDSMKATLLRDGTLVATGYRFYRHDPEVPISIPETGGVLPGDDVVAFSSDQGRTWTVPQVIPRKRPELYEISGASIESRSGDLLAVAGLYPMPDATNPSGPIGVMVRSRDRGRTWDDSMVYYRHPTLPITPYEPRITQMADGRLVAIVWAYEAPAGRHRTNQVVISHDDGKTWSEPIETGLPGQASGVTSLEDNLMVSIHAQRGEENPGVWVRLIDLTADRWKVLAEAAIYGCVHGPQTRTGQTSSEMFRSLKFGQPSTVLLPDGDLLATHWCVEEGQGRIRAHRLRVSR